MIEKMRFLSITGPKHDFDRVVNKYLSKFDIHLENALTELSTTSNLTPFVENNPYKELVSKSDELVKRLEHTEVTSDELLDQDQASQIINSAYAILTDLNTKKHDLKAQRRQLNDLIIQIEHFRHLDYDIKKIMNFKFIKFRFGKVPHEFYTGFSKYVYENLNTVF